MALKRRTHPPDPRIRIRIRAAMDWNEMSQNDLADMLGITPASVSLFLRGHTRPKDDTVRRIADGLGEDFDFLMGYKDSGSKGTGRVIGHILSKSTPDELELLRDIPADDYHEMMGELALKYRKRKRRKGTTTLVCLAVILAASLLTTTFEHYQHGVSPRILSDTPLMWGRGNRPPPGAAHPYHGPLVECDHDHKTRSHTFAGK